MALKRISALVDLPELQVLMFGFLLNLPWELWQAPLFVDMANAPHSTATLVCTLAALADAVIILVAYWSIAVSARTRQWVQSPTRGRLAGFVAVGLAITITVEWLATGILNWWSYAPGMPVLAGLDVGALPVAQWIILPLLVAWFVRHQLR